VGEVLDEDHLQLADQETEYRADGDHEHLVVLEDGSEDRFVLVGVSLFIFSTMRFSMSRVFAV
jgi:hypothetical protein